MIQLKKIFVVALSSFSFQLLSIFPIFFSPPFFYIISKFNCWDCFLTPFTCSRTTNSFFRSLSLASKPFFNQVLALNHFTMDFYLPNLLQRFGVGFYSCIIYSYLLCCIIHIKEIPKVFLKWCPIVQRFKFLVDDDEDLCTTLWEVHSYADHDMAY